MMRELLAGCLRGKVGKVTDDDFAAKLLAAAHGAVSVSDDVGAETSVLRRLRRGRLADQMVAVGDEGPGL